MLKIGQKLVKIDIQKYLKNRKTIFFRLRISNSKIRRFLMP